MKTFIILALTILVLILASSCTPRQRGAVVGGVGGAAIGGAVAGTPGAVVGGVVGGVAGSEIGGRRGR